MHRTLATIMLLVLVSFQGRIVSSLKPLLSRNLARSSSELYVSKSVSGMSAQLKEMRSNLAVDEKSQLMLDALRGKNLNDDDNQGFGIDMKLVEMSSSVDPSDILPLVYDPAQLQRYFDKRPKAAITRVWQVASVSFGFAMGLLGDYITGNTKDIEVRRAAELRNTIVSLGPFFIKLGQALSIRPDILSPRAMVELQQLCDKVPSYNSALAMKTIEEELGQPVNKLFSEITPEPVAAASLGQVYRARLAATNEVVAVKVQRPFVLETVSLDLHLVRQFGLFLRKFPSISSRLDIVSLLDEFANNFYQELDYTLECQNGLRIMKDMAKLPRVLIPKPFPEYCARRVHTAQWIDGEKLSQSKANDVNSLVNLGVITYLTQLLDTGFFHADPHPGNMLRTPDGRLVILDFGLMTKITDDQKFGMIEAIAHLIHRDYAQIGNDFINLDFIPRGTDTTPIIPALARVFEAALAGGGAKSINFQELAADLAEITFKFPFRIPPYFALIIRAISVLEGIALVGNPEFAIVDEAYPFISRTLLTDKSPRAREAFRYMLYGQGESLDVERVIDMLQAFEKFVAVKDNGDGRAFKKDGMRGGVKVGQAGDARGTKKLERGNNMVVLAMDNDENSVMAATALATPAYTNNTSMGSSSNDASSSNKGSSSGSSSASVREALKFFFSDEGDLLREFMLDEVTYGIDALSRDAVRELLLRLGVSSALVPSWFKVLSPELTPQDRKVVDGLLKLVAFFLGDSNAATGNNNVAKDFLNRNSNLSTRKIINQVLATAQDPETRDTLNALLPTMQEFAPKLREFGTLLARRLLYKGSSRLLTASLDAIFGPDDNKESDARSSSSSSIIRATTAVARTR